MRSIIGLLGAVLTFAASPALALDSFKSPSGNIGCMFFADGPTLRCDIRETTNAPPKPPADCDLDWGNAFEMSSNSRRAARICYGDTVMDPGAPVLGYDKSWMRGDFTCKSSRKGLSCRNARGAGWDLSRASQKLF